LALSKKPNRLVDLGSGIASIPSGGGVGIMNSPRVTKGNFYSPRVVKPQVVRIEIDLSDKWRIHHPYPPLEGIFIVLWEVETSILRDWVTIPSS